MGCLMPFTVFDDSWIRCMHVACNPSVVYLLAARTTLSSYLADCHDREETNRCSGGGHLRSSREPFRKFNIQP